jgi:hypothetical protein
MVTMTQFRISSIRSMRRPLNTRRRTQARNAATPVPYTAAASPAVAGRRANR